MNQDQQLVLLLSVQVICNVSGPDTYATDPDLKKRILSSHLVFAITLFNQENGNKVITINVQQHVSRKKLQQILSSFIIASHLWPVILLPSQAAFIKHHTLFLFCGK